MDAINFKLVIPARMASTRLPNKPLIDILGKSLIQRTWEQCAKAVDPNLIYVATDHKDIYDHCQNLGINVVMTPESCLTGTDRVYEFSKLIDADYYINVQGDEPLINPLDIKMVIEASEKHPNEIINGFSEVHDEGSFYNTSIPKVVVDSQEYLMYMSRAGIPSNKTGTFKKAYRQICIYTFPKKALQIFGSSKEKMQMESIEDIEILRFLELGHKVKMIQLSGESIAVDNPIDVTKVVDVLKMR